MKTKQILFPAMKEVSLVEAEYTAPGPGELTVNIQFSAVSAGTEKANLFGDRPGTNFAEGEIIAFPRACGYSAAGYVEAVDEDVKDINVGDPVVVFWGFHKGHVTVERRHVVKIPDGVSMQEASLAFISTFPLAAIRKTKLEIGESAMVMGLGMLGLFAVQYLKSAGAIPVIAVDPIAERREKALEMGADYALDPTEEGFCEKVKALTNGGVNVVIEVTGIGQGLIQALDCMKRFGRVALLGCTRKSNFTIDFYGKVHATGVTIVGAHTIARPRVESFPNCWTEADDIKTALALVAGGRVDFKKMISEIHAPQDCVAVFERLMYDSNFPIGVLFDWRNI